MSAIPTARPEEVIPERKPYEPRGAALRLLLDRSGEVLISGPAGTGKSRAALEKLHVCSELVPGCRSLILRKTRESLTESALVTFEQHVLPEGHPALAGPQRRLRQSYRYPNGSEIIVGGLDKPGKVMSTEYDLIMIQEAIEVSEDAWESATTRLRNGRLPYQQLLADTNPDRPTHWLKKRCDTGKTLLLESRHEDNPRLFDIRTGQWTIEGKTYIARLDALTGPRHHRLRWGRWVQAEGVVYDGWNAAVHLIDRFPIPADWPRFWVVDFGYTNPFVWQAWAQDADGRLYRYREIYRSQRLVEDHAKRILELFEQECLEAMVAAAEKLPPGQRRIETFHDRLRPRAILCDHDAEDRATLARYLRLSTQAARKDVSPGIQAVASRLRTAGDGKPRLFLLRDSLDERDPAMMEQKKPTCTEEELDGYVWDIANNRKQGEEPLKENDHGCDAVRYLVANFDLAGKRKLQVWT